MDTPHTIRLRGPWEYRILETGKDIEAQQGRIDISNLGLLKNVVAKVELIRRFNRPTGLDDRTQVELVIGPRAQVEAVDFNDESLDAKAKSDELRFDITAHLESRNILRIIVNTSEQRNIQLDEVRLEIHPS